MNIYIDGDHPTYCNAEDIDFPEWIDGNCFCCKGDRFAITYLYDIKAITEGGCASGAYMPAVTYHDALKTMAEYGDEVFQYIEDHLGELPQPDGAGGWSGMAVFYLSLAVELWASGIEAQFEQGDLIESNSQYGNLTEARETAEAVAEAWAMQFPGSEFSVEMDEGDEYLYILSSFNIIPGGNPQRFKLMTGWAGDDEQYYVADAMNQQPVAAILKGNAEAPKGGA